MFSRGLQQALFRTCAALATTLRHHPGTITTRTQTCWTSTRGLASSSTDIDNFKPADPPGTHGTPIFPSVDLSIVSPDAVQRQEDPNSVYVVTGASRGIGLQMIKTLMKTTKGQIVACCREPDRATKLTEFQDSLSEPTRLHILPLDLQNQLSIETLGIHIRDRFTRVDVLLNVAGLLGDGRIDAGPERSIARIDREWLEMSMAVNVIGPVMLTKELAPLLGQSRRRDRPRDNQSTGDQGERPTALVANLSARVGSISDNRLGGWYSYRMSKAALNQATRTMALELGRQSVWCVALHPGTTDTDLSTPFQANVKEGSLFPVEFTVKQLLAVMNGVHAEHSGGLFDWSGQSISF